MRAVRWHGRGDVRVEKIADARRPGATEVRVRVAWAGICGTDREEWRTGPHAIQVGEPHPLTNAMAPLVLGHEVAGYVDLVGSDVEGLRAGDLVALDGLITCGECHWCSTNQTPLCRSLASIGFHADGGLAEYVTVPARGAIRVPDGTPADAAALAEPLAVALRALRRGGFAAGEAVCVVGGGMIAIAAMLAAKSLGASAVSVVSSGPKRRDLAGRLGATFTFDPGADGVVESIHAAHDGIGPPLVVEGSGSVAAFELAARLPRKGGRMVTLGLPTEPAHLNVFDLVLAERSIIASLSHVWDEDFAAAVALIAAGLLPVGDIVAARVPLAQTVTLGFESLGRQDLSGVKVLIDPWK